MRCWRTCCILIVVVLQECKIKDLSEMLEDMLYIVVVLQECKIKDLSEMLEDMLYIDCCCVTGL